MNFPLSAQAFNTHTRPLAFRSQIGHQKAVFAQAQQVGRQYREKYQAQQQENAALRAKVSRLKRKASKVQPSGDGEEEGSSSADESTTTTITTSETNKNRGAKKGRRAAVPSPSSKRVGTQPCARKENHLRCM